MMFIFQNQERIILTDSFVCYGLHTSSEFPLLTSTATNRGRCSADQKQSETEYSKSAIADHAVQNNYVIDWTNASVLCKETKPQSRHIREAIWIRRRAPDVMNRDEGSISSDLICLGVSEHA